MGSFGIAGRNSVGLGIGGIIALSNSSGVSVFNGASVAYSLRVPAGSLYGGPLVRVRESIGNTERDFYASGIADAYGNRWIDTVALLAFCGAGSGFVTTLYSQVGSAHMTQSTAGAQPRIVNAGVVELSNSTPAIYTTTGMSMAINPATFLVTGNGDRSMVAVLNRQSTGSMVVWSGNLTATGAWGIDNNTVLLYCPYTGTQNITGTARSAGVPHVLTGVRTSGVSSGFANGTLINTNSAAISTVATNGLGIGVRPVDSIVSTGWYSEVLYFRTGLSTASRQALERSQGAAFGITVA